MPGPAADHEGRAKQQADGRGTRSQKEMLFMRGKAMSGAPIISGTIQLPKPPISAGMTTKKTMIRPCAVMKTFQAGRPARRRQEPRHLHARVLQLHAHHDGESAADQPGDDREGQVHRADVFVVGRIEPPRDARGM